MLDKPASLASAHLTWPSAAGRPIAPHNNSNDATWSYNETDMTLKLSGVGAYFAVACCLRFSQWHDLRMDAEDASQRPPHRYRHTMLTAFVTCLTDAPIAFANNAPIAFAKFGPMPVESEETDSDPGGRPGQPFPSTSMCPCAARTRSRREPL